LASRYIHCGFFKERSPAFSGVAGILRFPGGTALMGRTSASGGRYGGGWEKVECKGRSGPYNPLRPVATRIDDIGSLSVERISEIVFAVETGEEDRWRFRQAGDLPGLHRIDEFLGDAVF